MTLGKYNAELVDSIPHDLYIVLLVIFCAGCFALFGLRGFKRGWRQVLGFLLAEYVFLIYCSTVFFRDVQEKRSYNYKLFWSYDKIRDTTGSNLLPENIMNVVVFVPVGLLTAAVVRKHRQVFPVAVGFAISVSIETMQLCFKKGFSEFDDVFHNTLGCLVGCLMCISVIKIYRLCAPVRFGSWVKPKSKVFR